MVDFTDDPDSPLLRSRIVRVEQGHGMYRLTLESGRVFEVRGDYLEDVDIYQVSEETSGCDCGMDGNPDSAYHSTDCIWRTSMSRK